MKKHRGLGRGLDALIPAAEPEEEKSSPAKSAVHEERASYIEETEPETKKKTVEEELHSSAAGEKTSGKAVLPDQDEPKDGMIQMVRLSLVEPDREQPRKHFDQEKLEELAGSIRAKGLLEPILVRKKDDHYEIIAGERRWRACRMADLKEIPVIVREYDDLERVEISLIENIQRENLNPIEEANAYRRLIDEFHLKQDELAERVSRNRTSITNSMRLLKLCDKVQEMVSDGRLSMGQARALIPVEDEKTQLLLAEKIVREKLSVRDVEKLIRSLQKKPSKKKEKDPALELILRDLENRMNAALGMKVEIKSQNEKSGRLEITYSSKDDLEKLMDRLMSQ